MNPSRSQKCTLLVPQLLYINVKLDSEVSDDTCSSPCLTSHTSPSTVIHQIIKHCALTVSLFTHTFQNPSHFNQYCPLTSSLTQRSGPGSKTRSLSCLTGFVVSAFFFLLFLNLFVLLVPIFSICHQAKEKPNKINITIVIFI